MFGNSIEYAILNSVRTCSHYYSKERRAMTQGESTQRHHPTERVRDLNGWREDAASRRAMASKQREQQFLEAVEDILEPFMSRHQALMRKESELMERRFQEHAKATEEHVTAMSERLRSFHDETMEVLKELRLSGELSSSKVDRAAERLSARYEETADVAKSINSDARMLRAETHKIARVKIDLASVINKNTKTILSNIKRVNRITSTSNKNLVTGVNLIRKDVKQHGHRKSEPAEPLATNRTLVVTGVALGTLIVALGILVVL